MPNLTGPAPAQFAPPSSIQLEPILVDKRGSHGALDAIPTKHSVKLVDGDLQISSRIDGRIFSPDDNRVPLAVLNGNYRNNYARINAEFERLIHTASNQNTRLLYNAGGSMAAVGSAMATYAFGVAGAVSFFPGLALGSVLGLGYGLCRNIKGQIREDKQLQSSAQMLDLLNLFDRFLNDNISDEELCDAMLEFHKLNLTSAGAHTFTELKRVLLASKRPELMELMRMHHILENGEALRQTLG